ncbi:hypothetical protein DER46DRAFT_637110, partial [Fusarium sp. MPI-SDFR-AT-0072]
MRGERLGNAHKAIIMSHPWYGGLRSSIIPRRGNARFGRQEMFISIVFAVLLGSGYDTWEHPKHGLGDSSKTVFWVRDFLPKDLPSARIFTYHYLSTAFCDSQGITQAADKLLNKLKNLQADNIEILVRFASLSQYNPPWKVVHCYEELPLPGTTFRAVDPSQEESWALPQLSLYSHHLDLCRFRSQDDVSYIKVLQSLRNITSGLGSSVVDEIEVQTTLSSVEHEVLESL